MIWLVIIIVGGAWEVGEGVGGAWELRKEWVEPKN